MGVWAVTKPVRKIVGLRLSDAYQRAQRRLDPSVTVPPGGFGHGITVRSLPTAEKTMALTFDDGPDPELTPRLLDILARHRMPATFFAIGRHAARHPEVLARAVSDGHEVGNHTWSHRRLTRRPHAAVLRRELGQAHRAIAMATGIEPRSWRPPYGAVTASMKGFVQAEFGYPTILWSVDTRDWAGIPAETTAERAISGAGPGEIVLMHDIYPATIEAADAILDRLAGDGYRFATVSQMMAGR